MSSFIRSSRLVPPAMNVAPSICAASVGNLVEANIALEAECKKLRKEKSARQALSIQLIDEARALRAELAAIKGQEPVAIANKGNGVFWVKWTDAGKPLRGPGIKLYTLPAAPEGGEV